MSNIEYLAETLESFDGSSDDVDPVVEYAAGGGRIPPHSLESEQSVLGAVLIDNDVLNAILEIIKAEDFYKRAHQLMFEAMVNINERSEPIDILTLSNELRAINKLQEAGGIEYLSQIVEIVPTSANTLYYARVVKELSLRRRLIHEAGEIVTEAFNGRGNIDRFIDSVEQRIFSVSEARINQGFSRVGEVVKDSIKRVEKLYTSKDPITGVPTGFIDFDDMTAGLQGSDLIIIAGRPSMGKTALALSMARYIGVEIGGGVAIFSLEMSKEQIVTRLLCAEGRVSSSRVRSGKLGESDFPRLVDAASKLSSANIFIDDTPAISVLEMRAKARRLHKEAGLSIIIVDYLQLMRGSHKSERREQEISEISRALKALAKELSIPVVALSQLNRAVETRNDKRPMMADLRESGAIEQDADIIGFVYRDEVYNPDSQDKGIAEFIIGKHRNGQIGTVRLTFHSEFTTFENLAKDSDEYDYLGAEVDSGGDDDYLP